MRSKINSMNDLIGKEVQIYPGDSYKKWGRIIEINDNGVLFLITKSDYECSISYEVGSYRFISYSSNLIFKY